MGIQAWLIFLGIGAMTLIVWDGKRSKIKNAASSTLPAQRITSLTTSLPSEAASASVSHCAIEPLKSAQSYSVTNLEQNNQGSRIGAATHIKGTITADEPILIKGQVEGLVIAPNHPVIVSATGYVTDYLEGGVVSIDGKVSGMLKANIKATLLSGAQVQGSVDAPSFECMAGAILSVNVSHEAIRQKEALVS
ncbi:hypothetical protein LCGC14_0035170 [marine sediment metagenome]|uniref:Polymer-forming cytoskeletal protein n=1 Tax=marine sediment metagenome TaxID=412755 RepID=A0A0F9YW97_9ZZZZ|nr:polymer-forming cytoskeletal protein [Halomonas sp.]HDZ48373.1 polymer-forming cytoskeletal protein [Halomonas sp.]HEB05771.1 polymer-forming cytoskeletal protein [Halomonas sp.]